MTTYAGWPSNYRTQGTPTRIANFGAYASMNITGAGTGALGDVTFDGATTTKLTTDSGSSKTVSVEDRTNTGGIDLSAYNNFEVWVYAEDVGAVNGITVQFASSTGGSYTNRYEISLNAGAAFGNRDKGWNCYKWARNQMTTSGSPDLTDIRQMRLSLFSTTGPGSVWVAGMWADTRCRPQVMFWFDDGYDSAYDAGTNQGGYTYLESLGLKGNFGIIPADIGTAGNMTEANLETIYAAGHDLCVHGATDLTTLSLAEAVADAVANRAWLTTRGFTRGANVYVWPEGKFDDDLIAALMSEGFTLARATVATYCGLATSIPEYRMRLPGLTIGNSVASNLTPYVAHVARIGGLMNLYGHQFAAGSGTTGNALITAIDEWIALADYVADLRTKGVLDVMTASQWHKGLTQPTLVV